MRKVFLFVILISPFLYFSSCSFGRCMRIVNYTMDTVCIYSAKIDNINSVEYSIGFGEIFILELDNTGKIIINDESLILPDSAGRYCEGESKRNFFRYNKDNKGYFFIIKLETVRNYTWEEIKKNKLYDKLIVTREMLEKNDWKINYYGK